MSDPNQFRSTLSPLLRVALPWYLTTLGYSALALSPPETFSVQAVDLLPLFHTQVSPLSLPDSPEFPSEINPQPLDTEDLQNELGDIQTLVPTSAPSLQLLLRSSVFTNSNIFASDRSSGDTVFINSGLLVATPQLSPDTRLIASVEGGFTRYLDQSQSHFNFVNFTTAIQQKLNAEMFAQLGWMQERFYDSDDEKRRLLSDSVRFLVGRQDTLNPNTYLDSVYELRANFSSPQSENRVTNRLATRFRYQFNPQLQGTLDYQLAFKSYTYTDRFDTQHQLGAGIFYYPTKDLVLSASIAYLFGSSSDHETNLNNFSVGLGMVLNLPLF